MTTWTEVSRSATRPEADEHALVLEALGIPTGHAAANGQHVLLVPIEEAERARAELDKYTRENRARPVQDETPLPIAWSAGAALVYAAILVMLDAAQRRESFGIDWWSAGVASAGAIQRGAWWRSITALGLHADLLHLASNLAFGAMFGVMLAQSIGFGLAWLLFVLTGWIGNGVNAWIQSPSHASIGASTAVFGMLGVQVAHDWVRRRQLYYNLFRRWAPIAIGAALLAWLGGDGRQIDANALPKPMNEIVVELPRIDVWAHVLGFAAGLALGGLIGWARPRFRTTLRMQAVPAAAALGLFALAWFLALR